MRQARTKRELFINILDMWLYNEIQCIEEFCIKDIQGAKEQAKKEYNEYMKMYDELEEE